MLTYDVDGNFKILLSDDNLQVENSKGERVHLADAVRDCKVGDEKLSIMQLTWLNMAWCQIMAREGLIDGNPETWV